MLYLTYYKVIDCIHVDLMDSGKVLERVVSFFVIIIFKRLLRLQNGSVSNGKNNLSFVSLKHG